ncbi:hypothetical protein BC826DRAFT_1107251 [Russula brevipes]|nr:hypothetical protein BC826DRAFT_1107251 [Russula brevipes]
MSTTPTATTSLSHFGSIFASAFQAYKKKTGKDITSHPLASELQSCYSIDDTLAVLQRQIPTPEQSQSSNEGSPRWLIPTVNVLYAFSATLSILSSKSYFTGIGILLLAAKDVSTSREMLTDMFNRIGNFFLRLEIYTGVRPTTL